MGGKLYVAKIDKGTVTLSSTPPKQQTEITPRGTTGKEAGPKDNRNHAWVPFGPRFVFEVRPKRKPLK